MRRRAGGGWPAGAGHAHYIGNRRAQNPTHTRTPAFTRRASRAGRFAGAGLFESVQSAAADEAAAADYSAEPLLAGGAPARAALGRVAAAALAVEAALGGAQDVEGVVDAAGGVHVVQARPQVGLA
jgi:hypothetical protein